jgi:UDP-N-acetyl-D-glucosamine dehydrogenase
MLIGSDAFKSPSDRHSTEFAAWGASAHPLQAAVIGLGYVGLPLAKRLTDVGFAVVGVDIDRRVVDSLNSGRSTLRSYSDETIGSMRRTGFIATDDFSAAKDANAIVICVPTPLDDAGLPDLKPVIAALEALVPHLREGQLVSLESTTWPGTTREVVAPIITGCGLMIGRDVFLTFSPEREDPGNPVFTVENTPKLIGGMTRRCLENGVAFYRRFVNVVIPVSSPDVAEMAKVVENTYRFVNISLVNELKVVASRMGMDIFEVLEAAGTKPFGFTKFTPGPGAGGHCIPVDPLYLSWKAREIGVAVRFIALSAEVNAEMPGYVRSNVVEALRNQGKSLVGAKVLALGVAYKRETGDLRESPALLIVRLLAEAGAVVSYSDPFVPEVNLSVGGQNGPLRSIAPTAGELAMFDAVVLLCDHSAFDYASILDHAQLIIDTRGRFSIQEPNVVRA